MPVNVESLRKVEAHWAVTAVGPAARERAVEQARVRLLTDALGGQIAFRAESDIADLPLIERVATAYELAAIEGLDALLSRMPAEGADELREQAQAAAWRAFDLRRVLPMSEDASERLWQVLHLAALAYCGERWAELKTWLNEHEQATTTPSDADAAWDERLVVSLYAAWLRLLRKRGWDDLNAIAEIIARLREEQERFEGALLEQQQGSTARATAYRLVALYHWARATELLGQYMLQGEPAEIDVELDTHFEAAQRASAASGDFVVDVLVRWLHVAARQMVSGSLWWATRHVNSRVPQFVENITRHRGLFELLPPQRAALLEQGLLDQAARAIVVDLPTSGGKTMLAEFRILQALNQFDQAGGWVAYVAPTRALVSQITRRLRADLSPVGIAVEQLSSSVEIDAFEESILASESTAFDVLVTTPEKLDLVIRGGRVERPLALVVMDEAHNIEDVERGLRVELLLATIKGDRPEASFLLLMPYVPNAAELARWLAPDGSRTISLGTSAWQPNDRVVGMYRAEPEAGTGDWSLRFETLTTTPGTLELAGEHRVGGTRPLAMSFSSAKGSLTNQTAAMARVLSERGAAIAVARRIPDAWTMARHLAAVLEPLDPLPEEVGLVQRFLATEISPNFELIDLLGSGIGVHHAGLSDDARSLIEWLTEEAHIRVLCATTTIAQGINFPVSSVFLASRQLPTRDDREMSARTFWNLAGRAGRINQDSVGVVGIAQGNNANSVRSYVSQATEHLVSRLTGLLDDVQAAGNLHNLATVIQEDQWTDFRTYIAHLWNEHRELERVIAESERVLRYTFGYTKLQASAAPEDREKAQALLDATRSYAASLSEHPENAVLADSTGFSPEGVRAALLGLRDLGSQLDQRSWSPSSLFGGGGTSVLPDLVGIMMRIPQLRRPLRELGAFGDNQHRIAELSQAWVGGESIEAIATEYFRSETPNLTKEITNACRAIYRTLSNIGTWGLAGLSKMPTSGIDFENLEPEQRRTINNLPAMLYHGVSTDAGVLMRMNSVPRSAAERLGEVFERVTGQGALDATPQQARVFLRDLGDADWEQAAPQGAAMSGADYRAVWGQLAGEATD